MKTLFLPLLFVLLNVSCSKQSSDVKYFINISENTIIDTADRYIKEETVSDIAGKYKLTDQPLDGNYDKFGLRLQLMIEWDNNDIYNRRFVFGCKNDIIIGPSIEINHIQPNFYQYTLFDFIEKKTVDIIKIDGSKSPLIFYKSRFQDVILMENYTGTQRYKYVYGEGVSQINNEVFLFLIDGKYFSKAPTSDAYLYDIHHFSLGPPLSAGEDNIRKPPLLTIPKAWPEEINANKYLIYRLNSRVFNSVPTGRSKRSTDWKIFKNKYIFIHNSNENSNPYGHRVYYTVRTFDDNIIFTIPEIKAPFTREPEDSINYTKHETLIDFCIDQKHLLIRGLINEKYCVMIYDIISPEDWIKKNDNMAFHLMLNNDINPSVNSKHIDSSVYNVEPGTTTMYGIIGRIKNWDSPLYEKPDINSNIKLSMNYELIDKFKHRDKDGVFLYEMMCIEILDRSKNKEIINGVEDYWYQILFDSAIYYEPLNGFYDSRNIHEMFSEFTGWIFGSNILLLDTIREDIIIHSKP